MAKKSKAVIDEVIKGVMNGRTIKKVLAGLKDPISFQAWSNWLAKDQDLLNRYHQAKISALDFQLAEVKDELDKCVADSIDPKAVSMSRVNLLKIKSANILKTMERANKYKFLHLKMRHLQSDGKSDRVIISTPC